MRDIARRVVADIMANGHCALALNDLANADGYTMRHSLAVTVLGLALGLRAAFIEAGVTAQVTQAYTLVGVFFAPEPVGNYDDARAADHERYKKFFHGLLDRGVYFAPSGYETLFPSLAHSDADIDRTIDAAVESISSA